MSDRTLALTAIFVLGVFGIIGNHFGNQEIFENAAIAILGIIGFATIDISFQKRSKK